MRLLVVDDDRVFREEMADLLRDDGHTVTVEGSVPKAIERLEADAFDVVLTDLKMPRHSGLELLREVRARWPRTFVVVITGFATVDTALDAMKQGAFDYVRKPFRIEQIRETLRLVAQEREFDAPSDAQRDPAREARSLAEGGQHEVLFLGEPAPDPTPHLTVGPLDPSDLAGLTERCAQFVEEHPNGAVVIAGAERLLAAHRLEDVVAALGRVRETVQGHGPLRVGFNPRRLGPSEAVALGASVSSEETHRTLEAFANPIRRQVLSRLMDGPATFAEAMRAAGIDDSPKLSFHLRKLVDAGLIRHDAETYRLTARGEAGTRLLRDAMFLPPENDASNLAFPRGRPRAPD